MAKFGLNDVDNYGGTQTDYFSLKNDGDSCVVRFMYNTVTDIEGYAVHKINLDNNRYRYISCLREYNDPIEECPLCANNNYQLAKFYFNLYDVESGEVKLWERGKQILKTLIPILNEAQTPICSNLIRVIRHGEAGDQYTRYDFEVVDKDNITLEDLPDKINPMDDIILSYTFDELKNYTKTGNLPNLVDSNSSNSSNNTGNTTTNTIRRRYSSETSNRNTGNSDKAF